MTRSYSKFVDAVSIALLEGNEVLLVKRGREPAKGMYAFPGGRVEDGESHEAAVRRELFEETGLLSGPVKLIETLEIPSDTDGNQAYRLHVFQGISLGGQPIAGDDAATAEWYDLIELDDLPLTNSTALIAKELLNVS